jgi:hypothetical protein
MAVVVIDELTEHDLELAPVEDQPPVETLPAHGTHETFGECIGPRSSDRCSDDPYPLRMKDLVEAGRELGVSVTHQESDWTCSFRKCRAHVASLLENPLSYWVRRDPCDVDPSGVDLDEKEHVEAAKQDRVDGEEVTSQHR